MNLLARASPIWVITELRSFGRHSHAGQAPMSVAEKAAPSETEILLMRWAASDAETFRRLYDVSLPRLYNLAMRIVRRAL
jgi:hypothetical protein